MANDLKMELVLQAIDRATRPIRAITQGSIGLAAALKTSRDQLKVLQAQQKDVSGWRTLRAASAQTETALQAARDRVKALGQEMAATGVPTRQMTRDLKSAIREATALKSQHQEQQVQLQGLRTRLSAAGISTRNLSQASRDLKQRIDATNESISAQGRRMQQLVVQQKRLSAARAQFDKAQQVAGGMAAGGAAGLGTAYAISRPLKGIVDAFAPAENAATQLKVAMMDSTGQVPAEFEKITTLATELGDRLPGTTADFQDMMTMLRRQGLSAANILGGTGEAAAYLGVQLQMPVTAAAEFAAKMQDATRTTEGDMMGLMDTIQKTFYLGVDSNNMLQGFSKISPVMNIIKKQGLEATKVLTPLLVMMDQAGMEGGSAGNAYRKIFQGAMANGDIQKALDGLKVTKGIDLKMDFTDGKGEFGGIENMYAQLEKLKGLSTEVRLEVIKDLFGDDSETLTTLNTMMDKGIGGYRDVEAKLQAQADLRTRVNEQLSTLTNTIEAAEGSWTNAMSEIGATIAPQLKELINGVGELAVKVKDWVKEHPALTAAIVKTAGGIAMLLAAGGGLTLMLASFLGPFAMVRYALTLVGIKSAGAITGVKGIGTALLWVGKAALWLGRALLMTPIGLAVTAIAAAAFLIYRYWEPIKGFFVGLWDDVKAAFDLGIFGIMKLLANWSPLGLLWRGITTALEALGIDVPEKFRTLGGALVDGLLEGLFNGLGKLKAGIMGIGDATIDWFKEKLDIHSPSRVFATLGGFTMAGLEQGLLQGQQGPLAAVVGMGKQLAAAGAIGIGAAGSAIAMDNRPPLSAGAAGGSAAMQSAAPITITINPSPGMNEQLLARLVAAEVAKIQRSSQARGRSSLSDQE
ncbi:phage tail tape measure protein [Pseudomonas kuykendallii]|uniref:Phage tail tape measure protein n=1 Tax=Pseudomonas kuykendallii TaxID=1007099 RepID=A0A2W5F669_9PSED|nr:phage tail tape measure protein [Pseudomonas kuykendallii]PZP26692.1 MAG: phage tail tape measure protein [Pseudomonas kuykendallii]